MKIWQVDSFTQDTFKGNPAAVVILTSDISDELKQNIAMEMNLSETVFVLLQGDKTEIRWFTPSIEVDLCGHATLAAAHILWTENFIDQEEILFTSRSGSLGVVKKGDNAYMLDFPEQPPIAKPEYFSLVKDIIGFEAHYIASNGEDCMIVVDDINHIYTAQPDFDKICQLSERGILLTAQDHEGKYDFIYRAFFPKCGIAEDPVTGSATTILAPYWGKALQKTDLLAYQASKRGGELGLNISKKGRVQITGKAITVLEGTLLTL